MYFCYFLIISPWLRVWPLIWTNLNPLQPTTDALCQIWLNWPIGSGEEYFKMLSINVILLFPLGKSLGPSFEWINLNSLHPRMFCTKFGWLWFKRFSNFVYVFSQLFSLGKGCGPTWLPFIKGCFVSSSVEIGPVVLEKMKSLQTDGMTDLRQLEKLTS